MIVKTMHGTVILFVAVWLLIVMLVVRRRWREETRGRKLWRNWQCPECKQPFGREARLLEWRRKSDTRTHSALVSGPLIKCGRCTGEYWFTWGGKLLPAESMQRTHEIDGLDRL